MKTKLLPVTFKKYGYQYEQVALSLNAAIYAQKDDSGVVAYEVVRKSIREIPCNAFAYKNLLLEGYTHVEEYPSTSKWGLDGWTCMDLVRAQEVFKSIKPKKQNK
jgi:hypothetical protein